MKYFFAGMLIWIKTIFLAALFVGVGDMLMNDWYAIGMSALVLGLGIIVTAPLLLIIVPLIKLSVKIPYSIQARIAWLTFYLGLLIVGFYILLFSATDWSENDMKFLTGLLYATVAGLLVAVYTTRKRLAKLNTENINQEI